jgi:hypothetical protein
MTTKKKNTVIVSKEAAKIVKFYGSTRKAAIATGISHSMWSRYCRGIHEPLTEDSVKAFLKALTFVDKNLAKKKAATKKVVTKK